MLKTSKYQSLPTSTKCDENARGKGEEGVEGKDGGRTSFGDGFIEAIEARTDVKSKPCPMFENSLVVSIFPYEDEV